MRFACEGITKTLMVRFGGLWLGIMVDIRSLALAGVLIATPWAAAMADSRSDSDAESLRLEVRGHVAPRCGFASGAAPRGAGPGGMAMSPDAASRAPAVIDFAIDCNTPFRVRVASETWTMRLVDQPPVRATGLGALRDWVGYDLTFEAPAAGLTAQCGRAALIGGGCALTGPRGLRSAKPSFGATAQLRVTPTEAATPSTHAAGLYQDTLRIIVEAD